MRCSGSSGAVLALLALATPAVSQIRPMPGAFDPRIQSVTWSRDEVVRIVVPTTAQTTIELGRGETVGSVALGDSASWQVTVGKDGESLFVRPLRANAVTSMTVRSDRRSYTIELEAGDDRRAAYVVRYVYPSDFHEASPGQSPPGAASAVARYRLKGAASLRPQSIADDGERTYIRWGEEQPLPAVFASDATGRELTIDGQMRGEYYTIDRVWPRLVFRIDKLQATAERQKDSKP